MATEDTAPEGTGQAAAPAVSQATDDHDRIERIVKDRLARDRKARETDYEARAVKAVAERLGMEIGSLDDLELVREQLEKVKGVDSDAKKTARQLEKMSAEIRARDEQLSQFKRRDEQRRINDAITVHAATAVKPDQVVRLLADRFRVTDDGDVIVTDEKGNATDASPADFVARYLAENQHLLRPTAPTGGAASRPGNGSPAAKQGHDLLTREGRLAAMQAALAGKA
mgnify:FL=1